MPRDSSGNYTLAAGNPVVSNTTIDASWANPTLDDIATALTDSLDRQGRGGMLAPFRFADGTQGAPSITWTGETNTGFYREGAQDMRAVVSGVNTTRWIDDGAGGAVFQIFDDGDSLWKDAAHENSVIRFGDGTVAEPAITWFSETTMGWFRSGAAVVEYTVDGVASILRYVAGGLEIFTSPDGVAADEWIPYSPSRIPTPDGTDPQAVVNVDYVAEFKPLASGTLDGNTSTILGDSFGIAGSSFSGGNQYDVTLSVPLSNVNNAQVHASCESNLGAALAWAVNIEVRTTTLIEITTLLLDVSGSDITAAAPDAVMLTVFDSGINP